MSDEVRVKIEAERASLDVDAARLASPPGLGRHGWYTGRRGTTRQHFRFDDEDWLVSLAAALAWLDEVEAIGGRIKTPNHHSYWTKHRAEEWSGVYVANGTLILAAVLRGVKMQRGYGANAILALPKRAVLAIAAGGEG